jgi:hypothetical protein
MIQWAIILLLTAATVSYGAFWVHNRNEFLLEAIETERGNLGFAMCNGWLVVMVARPMLPIEGTPNPGLTPPSRPPPTFWSSILCVERVRMPGGDALQIRLRTWVPLVVFGVYPLIAFTVRPLRWWRRRRGGLCIKCGYDLTGNVSGVCPECGTEVKQP